MANTNGYAVQFTDVPELWTTGGRVAVGATGAPTFTGYPSGVVFSVTRSNVGLYVITLRESWYALIDTIAHSEILASASPAYVDCQFVSTTVGSSASGVKPTITFQFHVAGTPTEIASGSAWRFMIWLKRSSA